MNVLTPSPNVHATARPSPAGPICDMAMFGGSGFAVVNEPVMRIDVVNVPDGEA